MTALIQQSLQKAKIKKSRAAPPVRRGDVECIPDILDPSSPIPECVKPLARLVSPLFSGPIPQNRAIILIYPSADSEAVGQAVIINAAAKMCTLECKQRRNKMARWRFCKNLLFTHAQKVPERQLVWPDGSSSSSSSSPELSDPLQCGSIDFGAGLERF